MGLRTVKFQYQKQHPGEAGNSSPEKPKFPDIAANFKSRYSEDKKLICVDGINAMFEYLVNWLWLSLWITLRFKGFLRDLYRKERLFEPYF